MPGRSPLHVASPLAACLLASGSLLAGGASAAPTRIDFAASAKAPAGVAAPLPTRPMDERRFDFEEPAEAIVELVWEACPGARSYQVQLSQSADFAKPLNDAQQLVAGDPPTRVELLGLPPGVYSWRVAALDSEGRRGTWSPVRRFSVNEGLPPADGEGPPLEISSTVPIGSQVLVRGTTAADVRLEASVNGIPTGDLSVGLGGEFSVMLEATLIGRNVVRIVAVGKSGRTTARETSFNYGGD